MNLSFSTFINENKKLDQSDVKKPFAGNFNGIDVYLSSHGVERQWERLAKKDEDWFNTIYGKITDWIKKNPSKMGEAGEGEGLIWFKKEKQGFIISYRRARHLPSVKKKNLYIVTMLPPEKNYPNPGTPKFVAESFNEFGFSLDFTFSID